MKTGPNPAPMAEAPDADINTTLRFWACYIVSLVALGVISALMLTGFFLLMGYHVF